MGVKPLPPKRPPVKDERRYCIEARLYVSNVPAFIAVVGFADGLEAAQVRKRELEAAATWLLAWRGIRLRVWE